MVEFYRKGPFRLALAFTATVSVTTLLGVGLIYRNVSSTIEMRRQMVVADETAAILGESQDRVRESLQTWLKNGLLLYSLAGLFTEDGTVLAGNLTEIPPGLPIDGKVHGLELPSRLVVGHMSTTEPENVLIVGTRRSDGTILVLGRTLTEVADLRRKVLDLGLFGLTALLLASLAYGLSVSATQTRRLKRAQRTLAWLMQGSLSERLPVRSRGDDLDRLSSDVNRMLDMLEALLLEVKGVGDNIAHDLRTPLSVVRTRIERALASDADAPALRTTMSSALGDLDRALITITALLRLAEIENGQRRIGFRLLDVAEVCRDAVDFYAPLAEERSIRLTLHAPLLLPMLGDADLLVEAMTNLVDNAIKFTPDGGLIAITVSHDEEEIKVAVADGGPGIPLGDRDKIGKRFYRADLSRHMPGTGLGLSLVCAIAELHGFVIRVSDNRPSGAVVTMSRSREQEAAK